MASAVPLTDRFGVVVRGGAGCGIIYAGGAGMGCDRSQLLSKSNQDCMRSNTVASDMTVATCAVTAAG